MQRYDFQRAFSTWILSIAAHYCIDQIRRRRFTAMSFDDNPEIEPPDTEPGPEKVAMMNEDQRKVQGLLAALQPQDRAAIVMRYWYDFSYEEIAEALSTTIPAVKSRLHRARNDLAGLWIEQGKSTTALGRNHHGEAKSPAF
jgi:RNA polymerase sigma-70 factor (ECF subfamily)